MQDLTPVGLSEDGSRLVLVSATGEEFSVAADARLRAALSGNPTDHGAPSPSARPLERQMESALRPRDIQARIRAGESAEDVAAAAGTSVDAIMGFATPVLAERAHVAQTAQRASVRRSGDSAAVARTLGLAVETYCADHGLHEEDFEWDAWRRPDGRWVLVAEYAVGGTPRRAEFTHDLPGRYVVAESDDARRLTGQLPETTAHASRPSPPDAPRRLSAVPDQDELPLGDDALELVREREAEQRRAQEPDLGPTPEPLAAEPRAPQGQSPDAGDTEDTAPVDVPPETPVDDAPAAREEDAADDPEPKPDDQPARPARSAGRKKGRSSVPSWDEIMFGGGQND